MFDVHGRRIKSYTHYPEKIVYADEDSGGKVLASFFFDGENAVAGTACYTEEGPRSPQVSVTTVFKLNGKVCQTVSKIDRKDAKISRTAAYAKLIDDISAEISTSLRRDAGLLKHLER